jgi:hypothetical protein
MIMLLSTPNPARAPVRPRVGRDATLPEHS